MQITFITRHLSKKTGLSSLYSRITFNSEIVEIKLPVKAGASWKTDVATSIYINKVKDELNRLYYEMTLKSLQVSPKELKNAYLKKTKVYTLFEVYDTFINKVINERLKLKEISIVVKNKYLYTRNHLQDFVECSFKTSDIPVRSISPLFIADFENFLRQFCNHNSGLKHLHRLKTVVMYSINILKCLDSNPFEQKVLKFQKNLPVFLTIEEIGKIKNKILSERLDKVRDIFLFQCFTGLSYSDIQTLTVENIDFEKKIIRKNRVKTGIESVVFLLQPAWDILLKYNYKLPISSNQKMNAYLKEIATICYINKPLTTHTARHSFATLSLSKEIPINVVSKMMGHTSIRYTEHYAKTLDNDVSNQIVKMSNLFSDKFGLN